MQIPEKLTIKTCLVHNNDQVIHITASHPDSTTEVHIVLQDTPDPTTKSYGFKKTLGPWNKFKDGGPAVDSSESPIAFQDASVFGVGLMETLNASIEPISFLKDFLEINASSAQFVRI